MSEITVGGSIFEVYQTVAEIDAYADGAIGDNADAWRAADADTQARAGVSATRLIDRQTWLGDKAAESQALAFPRTGLVDAAGADVSSDFTPQQVLDADCELAMAPAAGATVQDQSDTTSLTRRLKAGSVELEYFRQISGGTRFPQIVQELIGLWLSSNATLLSGIASGVDSLTSFAIDTYSLNRGV